MKLVVVIGRNGKVCLAGGRSAAAGAAWWLRDMGFSNQLVRDYLMSRRLAYSVACLKDGSLPCRATLRQINGLRRYADIARTFQKFRI